MSIDELNTKIQEAYHELDEELLGIEGLEWLK